MTPGTRVRVALVDPSEYSGPDRFEGAIGTVTETLRPHSEGHVLVTFDKPLPPPAPYWSETVAFWFPVRDLTVLP